MQFTMPANRPERSPKGVGSKVSSNEERRQGVFFAFGRSVSLRCSFRELARRLEMSSSGVGFLVERGGGGVLSLEIAQGVNMAGEILSNSG